MRAGPLKIILIIAVLAAAGLAVFSTASSFLSPNIILEEKEERPPESSSNAAVKTEVEGLGVHLGDIVFYRIKVFYRPDKLEIDKKSLDTGVILEPFEVRNIKEREFNLPPDQGTRVYEREYELQLIEGKTNFLYTFPAVKVRLKDRMSAAFEEEGKAEPIFIAPRVPEDASSLELRSFKGTVKNVEYQRLPWILWGLGALFLALAVAETTIRVREKRRSSKLARNIIEGFGDISDIYRSLEVQLQTEDPRTFFHRMYQILRMLISRREGVDFSNKAEFIRLPEEIRETAEKLADRCKKAYGPDPVWQADAEKALEELKHVLHFYLKREGA